MLSPKYTAIISTTIVIAVPGPPNNDSGKLERTATVMPDNNPSVPPNNASNDVLSTRRFKSLKNERICFSVHLVKI